MALETTPFDPVEVLNTEEAIEAFIEAAAETGDVVHQAACDRIVARARGRWGLNAQGS